MSQSIVHALENLNKALDSMKPEEVREKFLELSEEKRHVLTQEQIDDLTNLILQKPSGWEHSHDSVCYKEEQKWIDGIFYDDFIALVSEKLEQAEIVHLDPESYFPSEYCQEDEIIFGKMHGQGTLFYVRRL